MQSAPVEAAIVIVSDGERYLVQRREKPPARGSWEFPGGKVEAGEAPEDAARRKCREELGLHVRGLTLAGVVEHAYPPHGPRVRLHAYRARLGDGPRPDGPGTRWVTREEFARLAMPEANARVIELL